MKRIFLTSLILIALLFTLTGCSNKKTSTSSDSNEDEIITEELQIDGTGKISLKELVESPKLATKTWSQVNTKDVKSFYNINNDDKSNTKTINGEEYYAHFSNDGSTGTYVNGVLVEEKNEYIAIDDSYLSGVHMFSKNIPIEEEFPDALDIESFYFTTLITSSNLTTEQLTEAYNHIDYFMPYMKEHNCKNIEDFAVALGFEETDKTMLHAIKNDIEYYADYESDFGTLSVAYLPSGDQDSKTLSFSFEDKTCWLKALDITSIYGSNGDEQFEELQIYFRKNLD